MTDQPTNPRDEDERAQPAGDEGGAAVEGGAAGPADAEPKAADYDDVDDASDDSFPASDPPGFSDATATRNPDKH